jgi:hypothetical protein
MRESESPPLHVRVSFRMHLPIQPQWRPWAMREIERRYGPNPSAGDRDIVVPPFIGIQPWLDGGTGTGGRIRRRPLSARKADEQYAAGLLADGTAAPRGRPLIEPGAFLERLPQRFWPWLPAALIAAATLVAAATIAVGLALTS